MERKRPIGKAVVRGSVRSVRRGRSRTPAIQVKSKYVTTGEQHEYDQEGARTLRKSVQGERMMKHDAVGGTRTQRKIIRQEGKSDRIRGKVDQAAYSKVKRHLSVRVNGKEIGKKALQQTGTITAIGTAQIRNAYRQTGNAALSGSDMSGSEMAAQGTTQSIDQAAQTASRGAARMIKPSDRKTRTSEKIENLKKQMHSTDKKIYKTDKKLGKAIVKSKRSSERLIKERSKPAGPAGNLRGGLLGSARGGLRQTMRTKIFLRNDKRVLQIAQQKSALLNNQQANAVKLRNLTKKSSIKDLFVKRMLLGMAGTAAIFLTIVLVLLYAGSLLAGSEGTQIRVSLDNDAGVIASFLYNNKDELWNDDGNDFVRISAVLGVLTVESSGANADGKIQHEKKSTTAPKNRKNATSSTGYQGLCSWTNEEIDEYISKRLEEGYYAEKDENGVADLYTQLYFLKEKLKEMKNDKDWNDKDLNPETAAGICYSYLIMRDTNIKWLKKYNQDMGILPYWSMAYSCAYFNKLGLYDFYAQSYPDASWDNRLYRYHICYPMESMRDPGKKGSYICHFLVPHLVHTTTKDEAGNTVEADVTLDMNFACHWILSSKVYEICYLLEKDGYRVSETSTGYIDDPKNPDSLYNLGLALVINQAENTKDANGEYHESNWGSVIDEDMAKYFMDRDFNWGGSDAAPGADPIWEFRAI